MFHIYTENYEKGKVMALKNICSISGCDTQDSKLTRIKTFLRNKA